MKTPHEREQGFRRRHRAALTIGLLILIAFLVLREDSQESSQPAPGSVQTQVTAPEAPTDVPVSTSPIDTPCTPTELSPAAVELVRLYEELHTFKDDIEFLDMGFSRTGPYYAWMEAVKAHQDANPGWVLFDELGFAANEVLMLGINYMDEDPDVSALSAIEFFETKIQAGLALTRCAEPVTAVQDIARTSAEARRAYVDPLARPPAGADDIDERVHQSLHCRWNRTQFTSWTASRPGRSATSIRGSTIRSWPRCGHTCRADTGGARRRRARQEHPSRQVP